MSLWVPFDMLRAPKGALGLRRTVSMHLLRSVVDVVLALTTLLGREGLTELALGVVLG